MVSGFVLDLPGLRGVVQRQQDGVVAQLRKSLTTGSALPSGASILQLPKEGLPAAQVKQRLASKVSLFSILTQSALTL